jgi:glycosyltransferase involved in cell wall biosynthesis
VSRAFVALSRTNVRALPAGYRRRIAQAWSGPVDLLYERRDERRLRGLARLVREAGRYDAVVVDGSVGLRGGYIDLLAAALIRRRRRGPVVVIADCQWELGSSLLDRMAMRAGIRAVDGPNITYCVHSTDEVSIFPRTWRVGADRVAFTPWPYVLREEELAPATETGGVFAGGDSLRDYRPLVEAARGLPVEVTIATRRTDGFAGSLPANVRIGPMSHEQYTTRLRASPIVVVPLVPTRERSAGQTTYVNALALGKLVVATDCLGVRDYVQPNETGLLVRPGDAGELRKALEWALDPGNADEVRRIRARARVAAQERFRPDEYVANLLLVARSAQERIATKR